MAYGATSEGFVTKPQSVLQADLEAAEQANIDPEIEFSTEDVLGQINGIVSSKLAELWELIAHEAKQRDVDQADIDGLMSLGTLAGKTRGEASRSRVYCTIGADVGTFIPAGSAICNPSKPWVRWLLNANFTAASEETLNVLFIAEETGPNLAPEDTITQILDPVSGWHIVHNDAAAAPGQTLQSVEEFREVVRNAPTVVGGGTLDSIREDVLALNETLEGSPITDVVVEENVKTTTSQSGIPPGCIEVLISDGGAVGNDVIAQVLWDVKGGGIPYVGNTGGTAYDKNGKSHAVFFSRPEPVNIRIRVVIETDADYESDQRVETEIRIGLAKLRAAEDVVHSYVMTLPFNAPGVRKVASLDIARYTMPAAGTSSNDLVIGPREIAQLGAGPSHFQIQSSTYRDKS